MKSENQQKYITNNKILTENIGKGNVDNVVQHA